MLILAMDCINTPSAHGGSYSIYYALAVASKEINIDHKYGLVSTITISYSTTSTLDKAGL